MCVPDIQLSRMELIGIWSENGVSTMWLVSKWFTLFITIPWGWPVLLKTVDEGCEDN